MKRFNLSFALAVLIALCGCKKTSPSAEEIRLQEAATQYYTLIEKLDASNRMPRTYDAEADELKTSGTGWWCSGFYPGTLFYLYEATGDTVLLNEALRTLGLLEKEQYNTTTHDLGFMMFCSFGNALRLAPSESYPAVLVQSAASLASRFDPQIGSIRSWDSAPDDFLVIIDNMMNLELLFWAAQHTGDKAYYDIAVTHADNTMKHHYRDDYSSYHVVNYHPETGEVKLKRTHQGFDNSSAWSRGQAWGLYGFVMTYRFTQDGKYLQHARHIADYILSHPNLPEDMIPYWDFNDPEIPNALRDASAGAIIASALLELHDYTGEATYSEAAAKMIESLGSPAYLAEPGSNGGFILKHSVGHLKGNVEVDVPLTYADYYFVEALLRARNK